VESNCCDIILMPILESVEALLRLIVPDLDLAIIPSRHNMGPLIIVAEVNAVNSGSMTHKTKVGRTLGSGNGPYLDGPIKGRRSKHIHIFWIDAQLHHVVFMIIIGVHSLPILIPVEHENPVIVTAAENVWHGGMHDQVPDEVGVFPTDGLQLLTRVVVVDTNLRIIRANNYPLFPRDEFGASDWRIRDLK
jgi:hypothetical protein